MEETKKSGKKPLIIGLAVILAIVAAIGGYGVMLGISGQKALQEGNYPEAVDKLERAFFSEDEYKRALRLAGEGCIAEKKYEDALTYYAKLGDDGLYMETLMKIADECADSANGEAAVAYYEEAAEKAAAMQTEEQYKTLCSEIAEKLLASGLYDASLPFQEKAGMSRQEGLGRIAQEYVEAGQYTVACEYYENAGMEGTLEYTYAQGLGYAQRTMESSDDVCTNLEQARDALDYVWYHDMDDYETDFPDAFAYYRILGDIRYCDFIEAWNAICAEDFPGEKEDWAKIFLNVWEAQEQFYMDAEDRFALAGIVNEIQPDSEKPVYVYSRDSFVELAEESIQMYANKDYHIGLKECGGAANKKVLVVQNRNGANYIDFELTEKLPTEWQPANLDEVEYVLVLKYEGKLKGWYGGQYIGVRAMQDIAQVQIYSTKRGAQVWYSGVIKGPEPPDEISYDPLNPPYYKSGGIDMTEALMKAMAELEKLMGWE